MRPPNPLPRCRLLREVRHEHEDGVALLPCRVDVVLLWRVGTTSRATTASSEASAALVHSLRVIAIWDEGNREASLASALDLPELCRKLRPAPESREAPTKP
jgi:hypothetical protein